MGGALSVTVIARNGIGDSILNPERSRLYFHLAQISFKRHESIESLSSVGQAGFFGLGKPTSLEENCFQTIFIPLRNTLGHILIIAERLD